LNDGDQNRGLADTKVGKELRGCAVLSYILLTTKSRRQETAGQLGPIFLLQSDSPSVQQAIDGE